MNVERIIRYELAKKEEERKGTTPFDCLKCGACCQARVMIDSGEEGVRLPIGHTTVEGGQLCMTRVQYPDGKRCIELHGMIGKEVWCGQYNRKPAICARFENGSLNCKILRSWVGLGPLPDGRGIEEEKRKLMDSIIEPAGKESDR